MKPKIITCHVHPPIPMRYFDWCAYREGQEEGRVGWGSFEIAAIEDLQGLEEIDEDEDVMGSSTL